MALKPVPDLPTLAHHAGHTITWTGWRHTPHITHIPNDGCASCGSTADDYMTHGLALPRPGAVITADTIRTSTRHRHRAWTTSRPVPAWPLLRLVAFACPDCGNIDIFDVGEDQHRFTLVQTGP